MDRNSIIGLSLIAILLVAYFFYFSPSPQPAPEQPVPQSSAQQSKPDATPSEGPDSATLKSYGSFSTLLSDKDQITRVENQDLAIDFSSRGILSSVELKGFKTYYQEKLILVRPEDNAFQLEGRVNGQVIDLYKLNYSSSTTKKADTTVLTFEAQTDGATIRHKYSLPATGYQIGYQLETKGVTFDGGLLTYQWTDNTPLVEKDLADSRIRTTVNYYTTAGDFDGISDNSQDAESMTVVEPVKWVAIRQKFFLSSIISSNSFQGAEITTRVNPADSSHVKLASVKAMIAGADSQNGKARFFYYFGPNDLDIITDIAPSFRRNVYLGWPPVVYVNRYVILPIFTFLQSFIGNYGLIIFLMVLIIRLILTPLSYSSYLGMAKMRLLKPELDLIKEKNGDNMAQAQQDQMKLYQQAGVNPFSGCIPLLLQMPILLSMFYFFPFSIDLRQERFLWAEDLSTFDSILDLPFTIPFYGDHVSLFVLLMTASTLISTWQNNQLGTVQGPMKSMSYIMPVVFMFILNNFSAGLSYYYFVSNLLTFAQQAIIRRFVDEEKIMRVMDDHKKKMAAGATKGKKSGFMARLEEAMKASEEARKKAKK